MAVDSDFALMSSIESFFAHRGWNPHRINLIQLGLCACTTGIGVLGAILKLSENIGSWFGVMSAMAYATVTTNCAMTAKSTTT